MFLLNSRSALVTATSLRRHPFSRSYGVNLPSSLTRVLSNTLVSSTCLPVSVCGTGSQILTFSGFSGQSAPRLRFTRRIHSSTPLRLAGGFAYRPGQELHAHNQQSRSKLGPRPHITDLTGAGISTSCPSTTPFGLALGPTNLQRTCLPEEP